MTIKNLIKVVKEFAPKAIKNKSISKYSGKRLAIDASLSIYKLVFAIRISSGRDFVNEIIVSKKPLKKRTIKVTHIDRFLKYVISLLQKGILPVFVFDGKPSSLKDNTIEERTDQSKKNKERYENMTEKEKAEKYYLKTNITGDDIRECRKIARYCGIPYIQSPEESDAQCAELSKKGLVDGVITDDMDFLLFGSKNIIKKFSLNEKKEVDEINREKILESLDITSDQLIDLGILLGCDYCTKMNGVGPKRAIESIKKYKNIEKIMKKLKKKNECQNYQEVREYFKNPPVVKCHHKDVKIKKIKETKLSDFLLSKGFSNAYISEKIYKLKKAHKQIKKLF
jgi:flap endonuclease-1